LAANAEEGIMSSELLFTVLLLLAASFSLLQLGAFSGLLIRSPARHDADWGATGEGLGPGGPGELQHSDQQHSKEQQSDEQHSDEQHSDEQHSDEQHSDPQLGNPGTDPSWEDGPADHVPERGWGGHRSRPVEGSLETHTADLLDQRLKATWQRCSEEVHEPRRPVVLEVAEVVSETDDTKSFYLVDPSGGRLPGFRPGQYLWVRPADHRWEHVPGRCYSLSCEPQPSFWRLTIKHVPPLLGAAGGLSHWMHTECAVGTRLSVLPPHGSFVLSAPAETPVVLLAAGVGITPLLSMLRWSLARTPARSLWLFYQCRRADQVAFDAQLRKLAENYPQLQYRLFITRPTESDLSRTPAPYELGKLEGRSVVEGTPCDHAHYYLCGPDSWMQGLCTSLEALGVSADRLHFESFGGGAPVIGSRQTPQQDEQSVGTLTLQYSGRTTPLAAGESILEAAERCGVTIESSCRSGICGSCVRRFRGAPPTYQANPLCETAWDEVVCCVATASGDIQVEA
jgi:ferredoxin-NADP reductase